MTLRRKTNVASRKRRVSTKKVSLPVKSYVKRAVNRSLDSKTHTFVSGTDALPSSIGNGGGVTVPYVYEITRIADSASTEGKVGAKIIVKGASLRGVLSAAGTGESNVVRCCIFQLKDPPAMGARSASAVAGALWGSASTNADWLYRQPQAGACARMFFDKTWIFQGATDTTLVAKRFVRNYIRINKTIRYSPQSLVAGGSEAVNPLFIYWISDSSVAPNPGFEGGNLRVYYKDS